MHDHSSHNHLSVRGCALSASLVFAFAYGAIVLRSLFVAEPKILLAFSQFYVGIDASGGGFFLAVVWGFLTGAVLGALFAWFYNKMD